MTEREMVAEFHEACGEPVRTTPTVPGEEERRLWCQMLLDEVLEFIQASGCEVVLDLMSGNFIVSVDDDAAPDLAAMAHENADVRVLTYGNDLVMGVDGSPFAEVMRANMTKVDEDGKVHRREDGKVIKPPGFVPADVPSVIIALAHRSREEHEAPPEALARVRAARRVADLSGRLSDVRWKSLPLEVLERVAAALDDAGVE